MFLARALGLGGAERQLVALARGLHVRGHSVTVATFYPDGELAAELDAAGVGRVSLDKGGRWDLAAFARRLRHRIAAERPQIVHGYLPPANVAAALVRPFAPACWLVWGVRASYMNLARYDWFARAVDRVEARLSRRADLIIVNSQAGREYAASRGFPDERLRLVRNGIDTARFAPRPAEGRALRATWGLGDGHEVIGLVARIDPIKDHETFLRAFRRLAASRPGVRAVLLGDGPQEYRTHLKRLAKDLSVEDRLVWLPFQPEPATLYSAFDVACSSSAGEGFSNALAEAMACAVPCVATRVGDATEILGDAGALVPPRDPDALADALASLLERRRAEPELGQAARKRVAERFSVESMVLRTESLLQALVENGEPEPS